MEKSPLRSGFATGVYSIRCVLKLQETKLLAFNFLQDSVKKLSQYSFNEIQDWPEYPEVPDIDLNVPSDLEKYTFTIMKDTKDDGAIRVAIQRYRKYFLGFGEMVADGFIIYPNGKTEPIKEEEKWELT